MSGTSRPDEIERATGLELPDGEYDTVAGLVLDRLERLAEAGDSVVVDGVLIEVTDVDGYAIEEVRLQVHVDEAASEVDANGADAVPADEGEADS